MFFTPAQIEKSLSALANIHPFHVCGHYLSGWECLAPLCARCGMQASVMDPEPARKELC
jgi:hypothetical protein